MTKNPNFICNFAFVWGLRWCNFHEGFQTYESLASFVSIRSGRQCSRGEPGNRAKNWSVMLCLPSWACLPACFRSFSQLVSQFLSDVVLHVVSPTWSGMLSQLLSHLVRDAVSAFLGLSPSFSSILSSTGQAEPIFFSKFHVRFLQLFGVAKKRCYQAGKDEKTEMNRSKQKQKRHQVAFV